jgi:ABC-type multidrug transport system fused ATPase/permease subunit
MKQLFKLALTSRKQLVLLCLTMVTMLLTTFASQSEMISLGLMAKKAPDFFELFAPIKDGKLDPSSTVSHEILQERWQQLDPAHTGTITQEVAAQFIAEKKHQGLLDIVSAFFNRHFSLSGNAGKLALLLVIVAVFKAITMFLYRFVTALVAIRVSRDLRQTYFEHIQSLPMSFYQEHNIGSLSSRVASDTSVIAQSINSCLINYIQTPFTVISTLLICFYSSWELSLLIFLGFPLIIFPLIFLTKRVKRLSKQIQTNQENFASVLIDFLAGIQTVKVFAMENFSLKKYREYNDRMARLEQRRARYDLSSRPIVHMVAMFFLAIALLYGIYVLHMDIADAVVYCGLLYVFYEPIKKFAEENNQIQRGVVAAERMFEVLSLKSKIQDTQDAKILDKLDDTIEFDNVWFRYGTEWVLKGVSFKVKKGEKVAIVGPTGAGKSTIVQLLPRLYDIQEGQIRINGQSITTFTQKSLRENIAFVPQRPFLFLDTVAENISFGRKFTREQVEDAAKRAHADEFICQLPEGYDTQLAELGKNLSGGQQQRLAIARALVKNAPILVLDEATSALDLISEERIKMALHTLRGDITQVIIAHRLSTIEDADRIVFIDKGCKIAEGTKDELLKSCPGFKHMWDIMHATHNQPS